MANRTADALPEVEATADRGGGESDARQAAHGAATKKTSWRMQNWRLRTKVAAVIVVPTVTALVLGGLRAQVDLERAAELRHTVTRVEVAQQMTSLVHELQKERTLAVAWVAGGRDGPRTELATQIDVVDMVAASTTRAAEQLDADEAAKRRYSLGLERLTALGAIRSAAGETAYPDTSVFTAYSQVVDPIVRLGREIGVAVTDRNLLDEGTVIQSLSDAKENIAKENAILQIAAAHDEFPADMLVQLRDAQASSVGAIATYRANASVDELQAYSDTVSGPDVDRRQRIKAHAIAVAEANANVGTESAKRQKKKVSLDVDQDELTTSGATTLENLRAVETGPIRDMRDDADALAFSALRSALQDALIVLTALLLALGLMALVIRSLLRPLRLLRREALEVAHKRLPDTVGRILDNPNPSEAAKEAVEPVAVFTTEETGQVARAFDAVQQQAVLMAVEQALLRENVNTIFVNLSRRSQTLVERQLSLIDRLEMDEQDPDQLSSLFELDHLATRMRRNSESLLVLSGAGLTRQLTQPVAAGEVVGAAVSEVEQYARVEVAKAPEVLVQGRVVSDLVHLLAELLDNAAHFSDPDQKVTVRMAMTRRGELGIQITDLGVGMPEEEIETVNQRLADPPDLDVAVTKRMGLYVVARLAKRHGVQVRLRENEDIGGGIVARVTVPPDLVLSRNSLSGRTPSRSSFPALSALPGPMDTDRSGQESEGNGAVALFGKTPSDTPSPVQWSTVTDSTPGPGDPNLEMPRDRLPIFDAVSQWFEALGTDSSSDADDDSPDAASPTDDDGTAAQPDGHPSWASPADDGWRAARELLENGNKETTTSGLPKRVPMAHLVPGGAEPRSPQPAADAPQPPHPTQSTQPPQPPSTVPRSADAVRGRMASFQQGVRRGKHEVIKVKAGELPGPTANSQDEEQE